MTDKIVHVAKDAAAAFYEPAFVVEHDGRFYLTLAVLEYDAKAKGATAEQKRGVEQVRQMFEDAAGKSSLRATIIRDRREWAAQNTGPIGPPRPFR